MHKRIRRTLTPIVIYVAWLPNADAYLSRFFHSFFFLKKKTAYEISECDWSSDVCSSDRKSVGSEEHTSELQSHSEISYAVFCLKKKNNQTKKKQKQPPAQKKKKKK